MKGVHELLLDVGRLLLQTNQFYDVLVFDFARSRQHSVEETFEFLVSRVLVHDWQHFIKLVEVVFDDVMLVMTVETTHLSLSHIEAVCIVWVDDFSPDFGFDVRVWK